MRGGRGLARDDGRSGGRWFSVSAKPEDVPRLADLTRRLVVGLVLHGRSVRPRAVFTRGGQLLRRRTVGAAREHRRAPALQVPDRAGRRLDRGLAPGVSGPRHTPALTKKRPSNLFDQIGGAFQVWRVRDSNPRRRKPTGLQTDT